MLDAKDWKIMALLDENARVSSSEIAKQVKCSRQVADYRIKQLVKEGFIEKFITIVNPLAFTDNVWHVYIKLQAISPEIEKEITDYLQAKKEAWWLASCQGEWDLIFSVSKDDVLSFDEMMQEFGAKFHKYISEQQITSMIKAMAFPRGYLQKKNTEAIPLLQEKNKEPIDEKDIAILKILATNARMPATEIASKTNLTSRQVIYRIKELMQKNIIRYFTIQINLGKLKYDYYKVCFYAQNFTMSTEQAIIEWCKQNHYVRYYVRKISPWTFEIEFETEEYKRLNETLKDLRSQFGQYIKRAETSIIIEDFKGELNILGTL